MEEGKPAEGQGATPRVPEPAPAPPAPEPVAQSQRRDHDRDHDDHGHGQQPPPQVIYIQGEQPKSHKLRNIAIGCVVGVGGLALIGNTVGNVTHFGGSGGYQGPVYTTPAPTPVPPLSHVVPQIFPSAVITVAHVGNQAWVDVQVTVNNLGDRPVQAVTIHLTQDGVPLTIVDTGGWQGIPGGVQMPLLGVGASQPVTLRVEAWTPNVPIKAVIGGNGVANDPTQPVPLCPTATRGTSIACTLTG